eukprot:CAMPEP_0172904242 /NCGR_PEP_ID=MMETSP1075-20121228/172209_1 /TAXON_ID=2916 /ORGANISM="Ceratium fusus, Strain PA161109" /LENGTH=563 /DNA_ID=CAMNT_0013761231 /DNA_START=20 /DNA_END=1711 /DNA_ORIENTATION=-
MARMTICKRRGNATVHDLALEDNSINLMDMAQSQLNVSTWQGTYMDSGRHIHEKQSAPKKSRCERMVKNIFNVTKKQDSKFPLQALETPSNIGMRIGQVLGAQYNPAFKEAGGYNAGEYIETCCKEGTEYDHFIQANEAILNFNTASITDKHMLIVVDLQQDFTTGSFGQPCWGAVNERLSKFSRGIVKLAEAFVKEGGMVVATKDLHPEGHCSFEHQTSQKHCKNSKDPHIHGNRYQNDFPPHCTYRLDEAGKAKPLPSNEAPFCVEFGGNALKLPFCKASHVGANFEEEFAFGLKRIVEERRYNSTRDSTASWSGADKVRVVYKGFHGDFDSFSAIAHLKTKIGEANTDTVEAPEATYTGGYSLPSAELKNANCLSAAKLESADCHPSEDHMVDPHTKMQSLLDIIHENGITHIVTVGLVYDFCVKETAIFAREAKNATHPVTHKTYGNIEVTMLANLASPAFDGKPGAPYMCEKGPGGPTWADKFHTDFRMPVDAKDAEGNPVWPYCKKGLGTTSSHEAAFADYKGAGVEVRKLSQQSQSVRVSVAWPVSISVILASICA